eukprot:Pgem_evm1s11504
MLSIYNRDENCRKAIRENEFWYYNNKGKKIDNVAKFQVLVTTYDLIVRDRVHFQNFSYTSCIVDEAHRLKNKDCKLNNVLKKIELSHLLLLTGTPIQNNMSE